MRNLKRIILGATAILSSAAIFLSGCGGNNGGNGDSGSSGGFSPDRTVKVEDVIFTVVDETSRAEYEKLPLVTVIKNALESVVTLTVKTQSGKTGIYSGVVVGQSANQKDDKQKDSYIAVSHTSIIDAESVTVTASDGSSYSTDNGTLSPVGSDPWTDVCVLRASGEIKAAVLYNEESLDAGEKVVAVGNLLGDGTVLSTGGIVSAIYNASVGEGRYQNMLLTDAYCKKGSLGAGVFCENGGFLIGLTSLRDEFSSSDVTPAVTAKTLQAVCSEIIESADGVVAGRYKLGIAVEDNRSSWGVTTGIVVKELAPDGCMYADGNGLRVGDVLLDFTVGNTHYPISSSNMHAADFIERLYALCVETPVEVGDVITFRVERGRTETQISIEIKQYNYFEYVNS